MKKTFLLFYLTLCLCFMPSVVEALKAPTTDCLCPDGSRVPSNSLSGCTTECGEGLVCDEAPGTSVTIGGNEIYVGDGLDVCVDPNATEPEPEPEPDPEPDPEPTGGTCANVPSLEHFTLTQNECSEDEINFVFAPNGTPHFYLHVNLKFENGRDILSAWCTGDETLCKAVGNGQTCGADRTGPNAWCYAAE